MARPSHSKAAPGGLARLEYLTGAVATGEMHRARMLRLVRRHTDPLFGLAWVPTVVADSRIPESTAKRTLRELAQAGEIELRQESGLGRMTLAERQACPTGPNGEPLSWARLLG
jgi:hypothetical protein